MLSRGTIILKIKVWSFLMTIGFRILERKKKVALNIAKEFLTLPVANVSDSMWRLTAGGSRLRPMHKSGQMAGPAPVSYTHLTLPTNREV